MSIRKYFLEKLRAAVGVTALQEMMLSLEQGNRMSSDILRASLQEIQKNREDLIDQTARVKSAKYLLSSNILEDQMRMEELAKRCIFIIGNARSGTTIMADSLNRSSEIFLMHESNLHENGRLYKDFLSWYNTMHANFRHLKTKGMYIPPLEVGKVTGFTYLEELGRHFRYVGEKFAFGPNGKLEGMQKQEHFFNFHAKHFYFSNYFLIIRHPYEVIMSMRNIFPKKTIEELLESWLVTMNISIDLTLCFPNTWTIFLENLSTKTLCRIGEILDVDIPVDNWSLGRENQKIQVDDSMVPGPLSHLSSIALGCHELYYQLKELFCPIQLTYSGTIAGHKLFRPLKNRIATLLTDLQTKLPNNLTETK